ncbi:T9SS C-terminal target domain-containing protein [Spirosoma taeanense]|uniref:T9SS C-terminal target domain-containing protein n=1 Tax=Spirosoma taeanense TaxID=2735870 RepID=A0A6M5YBF1_9BACT|nr:T9SS C-terminal target domain-containing protein [Spirosoma taeanense]QJW90593.1 T9SS C-terminal target domain-containing protein [Spirosoma taeanense]
MKKILLLMLGLAASSASFATTNEPSKPVATASLIGTDKVKLVVAPQPATATVALNDDQGHILYSSNVNLRDGIKQQFDISKLNTGVYRLSIAVGKERIVKAFTVTEVPSHQLVTLQD